ncbi:Uncharacterised protein [Mycobacteroides abscessus subsp. abscessus]|nr:Uncharacterised protein [Mycobacteroides abscessus subsp. abscessus]
MVREIDAAVEAPGVSGARWLCLCTGFVEPVPRRRDDARCEPHRI